MTPDFGSEMSRYADIKRYNGWREFTVKGVEGWTTVSSRKCYFAERAVWLSAYFSEVRQAIRIPYHAWVNPGYRLCFIGGSWGGAANRLRPLERNAFAERHCLRDFLDDVACKWCPVDEGVPSFSVKDKAQHHRSRLASVSRVAVRGLANSSEAAKYDAAPFGPQGAGRAASKGGASWESDPRFQAHKKLDQGRMPPKDWKLGPYAANKFFVSPSKDPSGFTMNVLILLAFIYSVSCLTPGESFYSRRRRLIRERIRQEYDLPVGWDDDIEWYRLREICRAEQNGSERVRLPRVQSSEALHFHHPRPTTMSLDTAFLQLSFTLPGRYTLPDRQLFAGTQVELQWEAEAFAAPYCGRVANEGTKMVVDERGFPRAIRVCSQHPSDTSWWWKDRCNECRNIYNARVEALTPVSSDARTLVGSLKAAAPQSMERHSSMPCLLESVSSSPADAALRQARIRALQKYPYNVARKGTDTNPTSFTGRVLSIQNRGFRTLRREFTRPAVPWH
ncbi:hypothetical protein FOZ60_002227 [Perkinsus olseni]|uniref:Uncharacterized protein n=1 Tax=Perkinsus olseni TaxID=32597 RepID=A0A7J6NZF1_PEROL|nr:hypothetical protein FOZ60_002227 [Perkinsus olseni]